MTYNVFSVILNPTQLIVDLSFLPVRHDTEYIGLCNPNLLENSDTLHTGLLLPKYCSFSATTRLA